MLLSGSYTIPIDQKARWTLTGVGSIAQLDYVDGVSQPGKWHSGVGAAIGYKSPRDTFHVILGYGYGFDAIRDHGRGAQSVGILFQWDLEARRRPSPTVFDVESPYKSRGLFRLFRVN